MSDAGAPDSEPTALDDLTRSVAEAKARKDIAVARREAVESDVGAIKALIPEIAQSESGSLETSGDRPVLTGQRVAEALLAAASNLSSEVDEYADRIDRRMQSYLVTTDPELVSADSIYHHVNDRITHLTTCVDELLASTAPEKAPGTGVEGAALVTGVLATAAAVIPAVTKIFGVKQTIRSAAASVDDLSVVAAVAGRLAQHSPTPVMTDVFRTIDITSSLWQRYQMLGGKRSELAKLASLHSTKLTAARARVERLSAEVAELKPVTPGAESPDGAALDARLRELQSAVASEKTLSAKASSAESLLKELDIFTTSVEAVPDGARRSALTTAVLHSWLYCGSADETRYLLYVKLFSASTDEVRYDRTLRGDKVGARADVALTYLLTTADGRLRAANVVTGTSARLVEPEEYFRSSSDNP